METSPTLMKKGFNKLQEMGTRRQQTPAWKPLNPKKKVNTPSKASKAIQAFYENQAQDQAVRPLASDSPPQAEETQKCFLKRPGCPRYSHQGTSTSQLETNFPKPTELPSNISTISLSSQLSLDDWASVFQNPDLLESKSYIKFPPATATQSFTGLSKWRSYTEGCTPTVQKKTHGEGKMPWYIAVLREKDVSLQKLGEELSRLTSCEAECARKDDVISVLREEVETMQKQLDHIQGGGVSISKESRDGKKSREETCEAWLRRRGYSLPIQWDQMSIPEEFRLEIERLKSELSHSDKTLGAKSGERLSETMSQEELEEFEKEMEIQQKGIMAMMEEMLPECESNEVFEGKVQAEKVEESDGDLIVRRLFEFQRMNVELYEELEKAKYDYDVATGAISSLQRQLSFEGSQLRRAHAERELLQKELRERGDQLEAMSQKFCNLREERKHEEMMGSIEMDNYKLRQNVSDLESKLADKSQQIDNLQNDVNRLQAELMVNQHHIGKQLTQQNELQRQLEVLQRVEQQTRVTLETISARFERFRSKIIQATYSTQGFKSPQSEITDDEVLEALQKIISDRLEFHQMLRQKGVKVRSLGPSESTTPTSHKKRSPNR